MMYPHPLHVKLNYGVQFSPLIDWVVGGDMRGDSVHILFQSFLQEALVSSLSMGRYVRKRGIFLFFVVVVVVSEYRRN